MGQSQIQATTAWAKPERTNNVRGGSIRKSPSGVCLTSKRLPQYYTIKYMELLPALLPRTWDRIVCPSLPRLGKPFVGGGGGPAFKRVGRSEMLEHLCGNDLVSFVKLDLV